MPLAAAGSSLIVVISVPSACGDKLKASARPSGWSASMAPCGRSVTESSRLSFLTASVATRSTICLVSFTGSTIIASANSSSM